MRLAAKSNSKTSRLVILLGFCLALVSCDPFEGLLKVNKNFTAISTETKNGCNGETGWDCEQKVNVAVPVGEHQGKIEFINRDFLRITLKLDGRNKVINIPLSKGIDIPSDNGTFSWQSWQIGQSFSIRGELKTTKTDSDVFRGYETCSYTRDEYVCDSRGCYWTPVTRYGQQYVEYFNRQTLQNISAEFHEVFPLAHFSGQRSFNQKNYLYKGQCF